MMQMLYLLIRSYIYIFISSIILKSKFYMNTIYKQRTVNNKTYI